MSTYKFKQCISDSKLPVSILFALNSIKQQLKICALRGDDFERVKDRVGQIIKEHEPKDRREQTGYMLTLAASHGMLVIEKNLPNKTVSVAIITVE